MDHIEAVRMQAVEKYILGELSPLLRAQFEEHYFDCADCALNLRAGVAFAAASRQYFAEVLLPVAPVPAPRVGWFAWLKPLVAVPAFAVLLAIIVYQNAVSIPKLKQEVGSGTTTAAIAAPWFPIYTASSHSAGPRIEVQPNQPFYLSFDITDQPRGADSVFLVQLKDSSGKILIESTVPAERAHDSLALPVPAGIQPGDYQLVITDRSAGGSTLGRPLPFTVAFLSQIQQH
ncbi:MAG: hypothetical protein NVS9B14_00160 [Candidatus Acidiferrum sp.]